MTTTWKSNRWRWLCAFVGHDPNEHTHETPAEQPYPGATVHLMYLTCARCGITKHCGCPSYEQFRSLVAR